MTGGLITGGFIMGWLIVGDSGIGGLRRRGGDAAGSEGIRVGGAMPTGNPASALEVKG
jgi:hypothetical protein